MRGALLLTAGEAQDADRRAIESGISSAELMRNAAAAVTEFILTHYAPCPTAVICGPGNNGKDGEIIAQMLAGKGWDIRPLSLDSWREDALSGTQLVVDALFGTGLNKPVEGAARAAIEAINTHGAPVVAVDIASGVNATTGEIMGIAVQATHTVTFAAAKLGQYLLPGKLASGYVHVCDIGIMPRHLQGRCTLNTPSLWLHAWHPPSPGQHKYLRGHALAIGGPPDCTGATKLAAHAALRAGAGLVSVGCNATSLPYYAGLPYAVMTKVTETAGELGALLEQSRVTACLIGPGAGRTNATRNTALQLLERRLPCVLDADALSVFAQAPSALSAAIGGPAILTPHEGEFARLFNFSGSKPDRALAAARMMNAVLLLKGSDTVIASPDGRCAVNADAPAWLATAGSGDVLSGIAAGLLAQGMPAYEAACMAAWLHGRAGEALGIGLIADDLPAALPRVLAQLLPMKPGA